MVMSSDRQTIKIYTPMARSFNNSALAANVGADDDLRTTAAPVCRVGAQSSIGVVPNDEGQGARRTAPESQRPQLLSGIGSLAAASAYRCLQVQFRKRYKSASEESFCAPVGI